MTYLVRGLSLPSFQKDDLQRLKILAAGELGVPPGALADIRIARRSLDARKKGDIRFVYAAEADLGAESAPENAEPGKNPPEPPDLPLLLKNPNVSILERFVYEISKPLKTPETRPVVAGFGPAGIFAALLLAEAGLRPIVLERGADVRTRRERVDAFWAGGPLDTESNVQFGEGGAGTFSDGKLNTGTRDARLRWVFEQLVKAGAPESILYDAKPHVGTDFLTGVVERLRNRVLSLGGEVRFLNRLAGLEIESGALRGLSVAGPEGEYRLPCGKLVLAVGHSARDTLEMLHRAGVPMVPKAFSMGARIEHRQAAVDLAQYGRPGLGGELPPADYKLSCALPDGSSAYTFCMCPGGRVVAAASEAGGVVTNGMSLFARDGENANSALLVTLTPGLFPYGGPLGGVRWQREIEQAAFRYAGGSYRAPAQLAGDFLARKPSKGPKNINPGYRPGVFWGDIRKVLPGYVTDTMARALPALGRKLRGFDEPGAVLTAPETRSSSPVRVTRGEDYMSAVRGLYPCGEGAGYAGGISSAAVDGLRCAEAVIESCGGEN